MTSERSLTTRSTEPLVAILLEEDGQELVRYFPEGVADAAMTDDVTRAALAAIGACSDLDWDEWAEELDRIRHESRPTFAGSFVRPTDPDSSGTLIHSSRPQP